MQRGHRFLANNRKIAQAKALPCTQMLSVGLVRGGAKNLLKILLGIQMLHEHIEITSCRSYASQCLNGLKPKIAFHIIIVITPLFVGLSWTTLPAKSSILGPLPENCPHIYLG